MVRQTAKILFLEVLGGLTLLLILAAGALAWRLSTGPMALDFLSDEFQAAIAETRGGRPVNWRALALEWDTDARRLIATASDIELLNDDGRVAGRADRGEVAIDFGAFLFGRIVPKAINLQGGVVDVEIDERGLIEIAGEPVAFTWPQTAPTPNFDPEQFVRLADGFMADAIKSVSAEADLVDVETISFERITLNVLDAANRPVATIGDAKATLSLDEEQVIAAVSGASDPEQGLPASFSLAAKGPRDLSELTLNLSVVDWSLEALTSRIFGRPVTASGIQSDATLTLSADAAVGLREIAFEVSAGAGRVDFGGREVDVSGVKIALNYDSQTDVLGISADQLDAGMFNGSGKLNIADVLTGEGDRTFELRSPELTIDLTPTLTTPLRLKDISAAGRLDPTTLRLRASKLAVTNAGGTITGAGGFEWTGGPPRPDRFPFELTFDGDFAGAWTISDILALWPVEFVKGVRDRSEKMFLQGTIYDADIEVAIQPGNRVDGRLTADALAVRFNARDVVH
ncbi:MAG: hypothetical protein AAFQ67_08960, partial [Pseudomonadota bacterium]